MILLDSGIRSGYTPPGCGPYPDKGPPFSRTNLTAWLPGGLAAGSNATPLYGNRGLRLAVGDLL
jgi:hypothetical protein